MKGEVIQTGHLKKNLIVRPKMGPIFRRWVGVRTRTRCKWSSKKGRQRVL